jgi:predicted glycosyltransferase
LLPILIGLLSSSRKEQKKKKKEEEEEEEEKLLIGVGCGSRGEEEIVLLMHI